VFEAAKKRLAGVQTHAKSRAARLTNARTLQASKREKLEEYSRFAEAVAAFGHGV